MTLLEELKITGKMNISDIAKSINEEGDTGQAAIINELGYIMCLTCGTPERLEMQICYLSYKLDKRGIHLIKELAEFIRLNENESNE